MKVVRFLIVAALPLAGLSREVRMDFSVRDYEDKPIAGVNVECYAKEKPVPYGSALSKRYCCQTDRDGKASVSVKIWDGFADCYFKCDGYYPEEVSKVRLESHFDKRLGDTVVTATEKSVAVKMRPRKNPTPMVHHYQSKCIKRFPFQGNRFGFDLQKGDWVRPKGCGEVADFYVNQTCIQTTNELTVTGTIEFPDPGSGAYVAKRYDAKEFPFDYHAATNVVYRRELPFRYHCERQERRYEIDMIMKDDEYLVIRSRVKTDADGKIIESNYTGVEGPIFITKYFSLGDWYFNPSVNDTNLEYERKR